MPVASPGDGNAWHRSASQGLADTGVRGSRCTHHQNFGRVLQLSDHFWGPKRRRHHGLSSMTRHALHYGSGRRGRPIAAATPEPHALPEAVSAAVDAGVTAPWAWPGRREREEAVPSRLAEAEGARRAVPGKTRAVDPDREGPRMRAVRRPGLSASPAPVPTSDWVPSTGNTPRRITRHYYATAARSLFSTLHSFHPGPFTLHAV